MIEWGLDPEPHSATSASACRLSSRLPSFVSGFIHWAVMLYTDFSARRLLLTKFSSSPFPVCLQFVLVTVRPPIRPSCCSPSSLIPHAGPAVRDEMKAGMWTLRDFQTHVQAVLQPSSKCVRRLIILTPFSLMRLNSLP